MYLYLFKSGKSQSHKRKRRTSKGQDSPPNETDDSMKEVVELEDKDSNTTNDTDGEDETKAMEDLLPKNIQKMNLLLNPDKKGERKANEVKAQQKYEEQFGGMDLQASYRSLFMIMWYSQLPCFDVKNITSNAAGKTSTIKKCFWKEQEMDCPTIFKTMPTDRGMCCVFNMKKAEEIYKKSEYEDLLQLMQDTDLEYR